MYLEPRVCIRTEPRIVQNGPMATTTLNYQKNGITSTLLTFNYVKNTQRTLSGQASACPNHMFRPANTSCKTANLIFSHEKIATFLRSVLIRSCERCFFRKKLRTKIRSQPRFFAVRTCDRFFGTF